MKQFTILAIILSCLLSACSEVPLTGRKQLSLLPESQLSSMSLTSYKQVLQESKVVNGGNDLAIVKRTGQNISKAVEAYLRQNGLSKRAAEFKWDFNLIDDPTVNAWCMPGGKVAIYTGILPIAQTERGLAVVMGHEVAHAVARHGNERMSQGLIQQLGAVGLSVALRNKPAQTQGLFMQAYGAGTAVAATLPFSRKHETEADEMGLIFMAMAGYSPKEAPGFWQRMNQNSQGAPPEFLSTHPAPTTRISNLNKFMPKAMKYYKGNGTKGDATFGGNNSGNVSNRNGNSRSNTGTAKSGGSKGKVGGVKGGSSKTGLTPNSGSSKSNKPKSRIKAGKKSGGQ